ncbi:MAG: hypothetical protein KME40_19580 [Komarekiella atlantica HA4396-MV6]|jgi:hypothetical protein|nr:hypothetical protein [Komarekiella atlantica HA4396-MV6]
MRSLGLVAAILALETEELGVASVKIGGLLLVELVESLTSIMTGVRSAEVELILLVVLLFDSTGV